MINLTDEQKAQFYKDSVRKELILTTNADWTNKEDIVQQQSGNNVEKLNLYYGDGIVKGILQSISLLTGSKSIDIFVNLQPYRTNNVLDYVYNDLFICDKAYVKIFMKINVLDRDGNVQIFGEQCYLRMYYVNKSGNNRIYSMPFIVNSASTSSEISVCMPNDIKYISKFEVLRGDIFDPQDYTIPWRVWGGTLVIALSNNNTPLTWSQAYNNFNFQVSNINIEDYITFKIFKNEDIVSESFSLTESLCSQENLKFGLCESSNCQVSVVDNNYQLKDVPFHIFSKIYTPDSNQLTSSDLDKINFAHSVTKFDITTTNDFSLAGKVLDNTYAYYSFNMGVEDYTDLIKQANYCYLGVSYRFKNVVLSNGVTPTKVRNKLGFRNAGGGFYYTDESTATWSSASSESGSRTRRLCGQTNNPDTEAITQFSGFGFQFLDENNNVISGVTITSGTLVLYYPIISTSRETYKNTSYEIAWKSFNLANCYVQNGTIDQYVREHSAFLVPLGKFRVKEIRNQVSGALMKKTLTLYDDLVDLEQNAFNWYTNYMYGVTTYVNDAPVVRYGFEFARQIFSSLYNFCRKYARSLMNYRDFVDTQIMSWTYSECLSHLSSKIFRCNIYPAAPESYISIHYAEYTVNSVSSSNLYKVVVSGSQFSYTTSKSREFEPYMKILVEEFNGNNSINKYITDIDDYFMLSPECNKIKILMPVYYNPYQQSSTVQLATAVSIYYTLNPYSLTNGSTRLFYYNYFGDHEIFKVDSSITGRDVVRSLLEVTGCLFRLDRYKGKPEFVYCTKSGLYPSQTLFPADDLYPRIGHDASIYESLYISTQHEDYTIKNIGKIQILKNYTGNDTESNVQWTYTAPNTTNENTYVIDDNIFYSNAELVYEPDNMPEIDRMLANMYDKICDMGYTPQITKAVGLPFVECGDRIGVITHFGGFETFVYNRTLKGIQALFDTFESKGDEYISGVNDF